METLFSENESDERILFKAFHALEKEKAERMLVQSGIRRDAKVLRGDFNASIRTWWMAAAVIVVMLASYFLFTPFRPASEQQLADNFIANSRTEYNFSTRSTTAATYLSQAQSAMNESNWPLAASYLNEAFEATPPADTVQRVSISFFIALVDLQKGDYSSALRHLNPVVEYNEGIYRNDALWLRSLVYIKLNDLDSARNDLEWVAAVKGWVKAEDASKLLKRIADKK